MMKTKPEMRQRKKRRKHKRLLANRYRKVNSVPKKQSVKTKRLKKKPSRKRNKLTSSNKKRNYRRRKRRTHLQKLFIELGLTLLVFCLLLVPVFSFLISVPKVTGYAMSPNLLDGKRTVVYHQKKIQRFDLIYFKVPTRNNGLMNIRRVIGLPGERIEYRDDVLYIDGEEQVERFLGAQLVEAKENNYTLTEDFSIESISEVKEDRIPKGYYLVLGDNRSFSVDSRNYGLVPQENIIGTIELIF